MKTTVRNDVRRETRIYQADVKHSAAKIFPLLCPTREYDWLDGWGCELLYSRTGVAEMDCIFKTVFIANKTSTWVVDVYQPNEKIQFCIIIEGGIIRNSITLHEKPDGTTIVTFYWTITAFNEAGYGFLKEVSIENFQIIVKGTERMINHYLDTGEMLRLRTHG
jgi:hypothetical protein